MVALERDEDDMTGKTNTKTKAEGHANETATAKAKTKIDTLIDLLKTPTGATLEAMMAATGWQAHSIRGAMSGALKKKRGLTITPQEVEGVRTYRIAAGPAA
jgi:hypothetical protein